MIDRTLGIANTSCGTRNTHIYRVDILIIGGRPWCKEGVSQVMAKLDSKRSMAIRVDERISHETDCPKHLPQNFYGVIPLADLFLCFLGKPQALKGLPQTAKSHANGLTNLREHDEIFSCL
jgi:hypothetical protein